MRTAHQVAAAAAGLWAVAILVALLAGGDPGSSRPDAQPQERAAGPSAHARARTQERILRTYANLPLAFVENRGQTDSRVRYHAQGSRYGFFLTPTELALAFHRGSERPSGGALALRFLEGNPRVVLKGEQRLPGKVNYLRGNDPARWRTGLRGYGRIVYSDLWPGVDLALRGRAGELKYEFRVRPGARPADIRLSWRGADRVRQDGAGGLLIETALGVLRDSPPVAYQLIGGARVPVDTRYVLNRRGDVERSYGFAVGRGYRPDRELIIDPGLAYSTFLGGGAHEESADIAVDASGNAYVTGFTQSPDFPTTLGAFDRTGAAGNNLDAFVTKLNATGSALVYSTFLGGSNFEWGRGLALDAAGNAYLAGQTKSSNFPTTGGAFDRTFNVDDCPRCGIDQYDAFVAKLNPSGSRLVFSTFLGGTDFDDAFAVAVDGAGNAHVTGQTGSTTFPTTGGAFDRSRNGSFDAFVTKLNTTGSALVYSTLLGGADNELPAGVAIDAAGNAYVGGGTRSADFPTTSGAFDTTHNGGAFDELFDAFVTKLNAAGTALVYSTFLGGSKSDFTAGFAVDSARNAYVVGSTLSPDFPTTPGVFDPVFAGSEGFVAKLNATGSVLVYSTFLGEASASAVAPDGDGNAWLAGSTSSPSATTTPDASDGQFNGGPSDAYVAQLNATGSALLFATFLGGSGSEGAGAVALDPAGSVYVTGQTVSADFPTTAGAFDRVFNGDPSIFWGDAFVVKIAFGSAAPPPPPPPPPAPAAPALVSPADGAVVAQPVTFDWTDVADAASYTIQVDEISEFGAPLILSANATASQFTTSSLPDGNWFWRVRGVNSAGTPGAWSAVHAIQVESAPPPPSPTPGAPSLVSPAESAVVTQPFTFDWSDVAAAAWYTIEVDDASSFAAPLVWAATSTPSELATNSLPNGTLFWRVRAFNSDGVGGPFSAVRTVQVQASAPPPPPPAPGPLASPSLLSPAYDARFSPGQSITFDWSDVSGAASYTIQIDDTESFSAPLTVNQTTSTSQLTTSTLPTIRMWWRVRANDASGAPGNWSSVRRFEVKS